MSRTPKATVIMVRLSPEEKRAIEKAARKAGHKFPAQWVRDVALASIPS
jgi:ribosomal protein L16/L10AE